MGSRARDGRCDRRRRRRHGLGLAALSFTDCTGCRFGERNRGMFQWPQPQFRRQGLERDATKALLELRDADVLGVDEFKRAELEGLASMLACLENRRPES